MKLKPTLGLAVLCASGAMKVDAQSSEPPCDKGDIPAFRNCITSRHPPGTPAVPLERFLEAEGFVRAKGDPPGRAYYRWTDNSWRGSLANYKFTVLLRINPEGRLLEVKVP
jgi:hypothetical protein